MRNTFAQVIITLAAVLTLTTPALAFALEVGDKAPSFSGASIIGTVSLTDYSGKQHVVLALYFAVFTPV